MDGDNLNNWVAVPYTNTDPEVQAARKRLLAPGGRLTPQEAERIRERLMAMPCTGGGSTGNLPIQQAAA